MSKARSDIQRLMPILEAVFQSEQMKMSKIVTQMNTLKQQLTDLDQAQRFDPLSSESRGGAEMLWETWVQDRKKLINQELLLVAQRREIARTSMAAALSKLEAARQMNTRAQKLALQVQIRRSSW